MNGSAPRIGNGFDVHRLVEGRKLILGGVEIPYEKGLLGHSDADVLTHAIMDAILGALGLGDIGKHFPDTDPAYRGADSLILLDRVWTLATERRFALGNLDATLIAQAPRFAPYLEAMKRRLAERMACSVDQINLKATTTERLGFTGRSEGIAAMASVLLVPIEGRG